MEKSKETKKVCSECVWDYLKMLLCIIIIIATLPINFRVFSNSYYDTQDEIIQSMNSTAIQEIEVVKFSGQSYVKTAEVTPHLSTLHKMLNISKSYGEYFLVDDLNKTNLKVHNVNFISVNFTDIYNNKTISKNYLVDSEKEEQFKGLVGKLIAWHDKFNSELIPIFLLLLLIKGAIIISSIFVLSLMLIKTTFNSYEII